MKIYLQLLCLLSSISIMQCMILQRIDTSKNNYANYLHIISNSEQNIPNIIDASNNQLRSLDQIEKYIKNTTLVRHIIADNNQIEKVDIDEILHKFPNLKSLKIQKNNITSIKCSQLPQGFYLNASHNRLEKLPKTTSFAGCEGIIDLSNNYLSESESILIKKKSIIPLLQKYNVTYRSEFIACLKRICTEYLKLKALAWCTKKLFLSGVKERVYPGGKMIPDDQVSDIDNALIVFIVLPYLASKYYPLLALGEMAVAYKNNLFSFHKSKPNAIKTHNQFSSISANNNKGLKDL